MSASTRTLLATLPLLLAVALLQPAPAAAQCSTGIALQQGCDGVTYEGCCDGHILVWCEGGWLCATDCFLSPSCGWDSAEGFYNCGTWGDAAPGNSPPLSCDDAGGPTDADGDGWDTTVDCDDGNGAVYPGAYENCYDGIDNDCDGLVDGADGDCTGGDDDAYGDDDDHGDDDSDPASDDDTYGDDDTGPPGPPGQDEDGYVPTLGIACSCRLAGTSAAPAAALAALGLLALLLRRR